MQTPPSYNCLDLRDPQVLKQILNQRRKHCENRGSDTQYAREQLTSLPLSSACVRKDEEPGGISCDHEDAICTPK